MADEIDALPTYGCRQFRPDHLELALVQVRFPQFPRYAEPGYLADFRDAISAQYPLSTVEKAVGLLLTPQGMMPVPGQTGPDVYRFSTITGDWTVTLTEDTVSLESRNGYTRIDDCSKRFTDVLHIVGETLRPRHQLRFGLRYVNEFRHDRGSSLRGWAELGLNQDLLGSATLAALGGIPQQTISEYRTVRSDGSLAVRHGFLIGTTVPPTAGRLGKSGPFFLLDLDYFDEAAGAFEPSAINRLGTYNDFLYRFFRWAIGEGELFRSLVIAEQ